MEKALLEKLRNNNCDDIDKDMILARVKNAMNEYKKVIDAFDAGIDYLYKNYADELKMCGVAIVAGCTDSIHTFFGAEDIPFKCCIGNNEGVEIVMKQLKELVEK